MQSQIHKDGICDTATCTDCFYERNQEKINHPKHYNFGTIEAIVVIEDWKLNFNLGNTIKYIARAEHKGDKIENIKKALWYLTRELNNIQKEGEKIF